MAAIEKLASIGKQAFGLALPGQKGFVLITKSTSELQAMIEGTGSQALKALDVSVLHSVILEKLVGLRGLESISYTRDPDGSGHRT